ncbi:OmpA family protein [Pseudomonas citronellolis]|uniref:OmpA family protein n=1 Tax=Pseudomonas citronellolis TaxID=53408 RepID=UPI0023E35AC6|nr:type VI secretion system ImpA family N-terminal domain-containing protein [Pseudomonas citronellolis]MDF3934178.1 type VI secretion system ImpA family N-terminal domain-containing protein [Pseudomonas citronellolis]
MIVVESSPRLGGNPRDCTDYAALREELGKLNHPARPDVDWPRVERLCLALRKENGSELQTLAALAVARAQQRALPGMLAGVGELVRFVTAHWPAFWPQAHAARLEILAWLFAQLQPLLRRQSLEGDDLPLANQLRDDLARLDDFLAGQGQVPLAALQSLRQLLDHLIERLERDTVAEPVPRAGAREVRVRLAGAAPAEPRQMVTVAAEANPTVVVVEVGSAAPPPRKAGAIRALLWLLGAAMCLALSWLLWRELQPAAPVDPATEMQPRAPVRLDGRLLFKEGSAALKPESDKLLIAGLIDIKAQPGWLIVITGHSDSTGDPQRNRQLSYARALAVRDWMQRMGDIPGDCFVVRGAGAAEPLASDDTEEGRSANRRVEITLVPDGFLCKGPMSGKPAVR